MSMERIRSITLDDASIIKRAPEIEHERTIAMTDLITANEFAPKDLNSGPYDVFLSVAENRLTFDIRSDSLTDGHQVVLAISPFRRIIKDYFLMCESFFEAIKAANTYRVEAVDMGRRGIHNEGSELLQELLEDKITIDFNTARRLFTLICVLHIS